MFDFSQCLGCNGTLKMIEVCKEKHRQPTSTCEAGIDVFLIQSGGISC